MPSRIVTPAGSSSHHAQLAQHNHGNNTIAEPGSQSNNLTSYGTLPVTGLPRFDEPTVATPTPIHGLTRAYFSLVREGIINPDEYRLEHPNYGNLRSMVWPRAFGTMPTGFANNNNDGVEVRE